MPSQWGKRLLTLISIEFVNKYPTVAWGDQTAASPLSPARNIHLTQMVSVSVNDKLAATSCKRIAAGPQPMPGRLVKFTGEDQKLRPVFIHNLPEGT